MQNRSMFPYRRHGSKKRGRGGPARKPHGPQKGLPNSPRELLPLLQPATKALAQVLAGRTRASGQLGHARALLAQAERLIAERQHNRLPPAEREEFFEQLARLKLTLADADAELETQAEEREEAARRPAPPPIAQERLREIALSLVTPEPGPETAAAPSGPTEMTEQPAAEPESRSAPAAAETPAAKPARRAIRPTGAAKGARLTLPEARKARLTLPEARGHGEAPDQADERTDRDGGVATDGDGGAAPPSVGSGTMHSSRGPGNGADDPAETEVRAKTGRRTRKPAVGIPEGWIIDEEGYVVPGSK